MLYVSQVVEVQFCAGEFAPGEAGGAAQGFFTLLGKGCAKFLQADREVGERWLLVECGAGARFAFIAAGAMEFSQLERAFALS